MSQKPQAPDCPCHPLSAPATSARDDVDHSQQGNDDHHGDGDDGDCGGGEDHLWLLPFGLFAENLGLGHVSDVTPRFEGWRPGRRGPPTLPGDIPARSRNPRCLFRRLPRSVVEFEEVTHLGKPATDEADRPQLSLFGSGPTESKLSWGGTLHLRS